MSKVVITKCKTYTVWFECFVREFELWVGLKNRPDQDINIEAINILMEKLEADVMERGTTV